MAAGGGDALRMFSDSQTEKKVTVGIPRTQLKQATAYESRIGGLPIWLDANSAFSGRLSCGSCGSDKDMLMVAQIYAPVDCERSLYLFCCNKRHCSLRDEGWKVLRNQYNNQGNSKEDDRSKPTIIQDKIDRRNGEVVSVWGGSTGGESLSSLVQGIDDDPYHEDLLSMLNARDVALDEEGNDQLDRSSQQSFAGHGAPPDNGSVSSTLVGLEWRPSFTIELQEDMYCDSGGTHDSDEEDSTLEKAAASEGQVQSLLNRYLEDEEDEALVRRLRVHLNANNFRTKDRESSPLREEEERLNHDEDSDDGHNQGKEETEKKKYLEAWENKISSDNPISEAEIYFQRRIALQPRQAVRYAYGGQPLWCTAQSHSRSNGESVPACENCGAKRVFEFQLMPGLLTLKKKTYLAGSTDAYEVTMYSDERASKGERHSTDATITVSEACDDGKYPQPTEGQLQHMQRFIDDGLDFGVVSVWVCPNACAEGTEEAAIVQPPPDF